MSALRRDNSDIFETLCALPPPLGRVERPEERVELRVRALAMVPATEPLLSTFMRVQYLVSQRLMADDKENMVVRDTDLTETLSIPADASLRVSQLVFAEDWMLGGGSGNVDGHWERDINERSLPIRGVKSIDDYLQVEGQRFWNRPANRSSAPAFMPIEEPAFIEPDEPAQLPEPVLLASQLHPAFAGRAAALLGSSVELGVDSAADGRLPGPRRDLLSVSLFSLDAVRACGGARLAARGGRRRPWMAGGMGTDGGAGNCASSEAAHVA